MVMKKFLILLFAAFTALVSCGKEELKLELGKTQSVPITFDLTAMHDAATKAVKTGWETGDAIFVFFTGAEAPKHLKMSFDGTAWSSAEYDGETLSPGALGLKNGDTGSMRAVFLPFGSDATVLAIGESFRFERIQYTYYLTATLEYTVKDNKVSGAFDMKIPDGYVQFFIEDASATDGAYKLGCDAVIPTGVASISADGTLTETADKTVRDDMRGYVYKGGYLFSGKLNPKYGYSGRYYFAKTRIADNSRADYFVSGKTLSSHSSVKLPGNDSIFDSETDVLKEGKWIPVGKDKWVYLYRQTGDDFSPIGGIVWATCNYGESVPEAVEKSYTYDEANNLSANGALPRVDQFILLTNNGNVTDFFSYAHITVHGQDGLVIRADRGFLFLPATVISPFVCEYWSADEKDAYEDFAWYFSFNGMLFEREKCILQWRKTERLAVRLIL